VILDPYCTSLVSGCTYLFAKIPVPLQSACAKLRFKPKLYDG